MTKYAGSSGFTNFCFLEVIPPQSNVLNISKPKIEVSNYAKSNKTYISYLCEICHYSPFVILCNDLLVIVKKTQKLLKSFER